MKEPHDPQTGWPRWPHDRWISPTALNTYRNCAYRVRLAHIDRVPEPPGYHVFLRKGRIAHNILRDITHLLKRRYPVIDEDEILKRARLRLRPQVFPPEAERELHVKEIVRWVLYGSRYLAPIPDPTWLLIENNQTRRWAVYPGRAPYTIMARPDVVLQCIDEEDQRLIEIIDYKTGQIRPEDDPPVLMRFVIRDLLARAVGNASSAHVRFTWLSLDSAGKTQIDLSVEHCNEHWSRITKHLHDLASETAWKATPSFLCRYCPYHRNACTAEIPLEDPGYS